MRSYTPVFLGALSSITFMLFYAGTHAESLSERLAKKHPQFSAEIHMACGKLDKSNCAQVIPRLNEHSVSHGLRILPDESEGSAESAQGVCQGLVETAVGQRDAFDVVRHLPECAGKYNTIGEPLYPYFGFFVVSANANFKSVTEMVDMTPEGKARIIAAGKVGSGGQTTLANILTKVPKFKRAISISDFDQSTALQRITDGTLDGFFVMDGPGSDLIDRIKNAQNKDGQPIYKFLDLRPGDEFYASSDWSGRALYKEVTISSGWISDVRTVSVDAVVIASEQWRNNHPGTEASTVLAQAIYDAQAAIFGDTKTPRDWKPTSAKSE